MKGQIYIIIAIVIIIAIGTIANIAYYSSLPVQKEQIALSDTSAMMNNINNELTAVTKVDVTKIDDFLNFSIEYAKEKNFNITIEKTEY